jgi:sulfonate transport system ATP-binding protein
MLVLANIGKTYPNGVRALDDITLNIAPGGIVVVVGGSGCGKSTLLRIIGGLDRPSEGRVALDGAGIDAPREEIGLVFQEPRLFPWLSVEGNVGFGLEDRPTRERADRVGAQLARVGLAEKAGAWPRELSGGQAQRVSLARALIVRPQVLLLDEPFSALDAFTRSELQDHLLDLWDEARPILLLVTHDIEEALVLASRIAVMRSPPGRIAGIIDVPLPRPRDRLSPAFEQQKRRVLGLLDAALSRPARKPPLHDYQI